VLGRRPGGQALNPPGGRFFAALDHFARPSASQLWRFGASSSSFAVDDGGSSEGRRSGRLPRNTAQKPSFHEAARSSRCCGFCGLCRPEVKSKDAVIPVGLSTDPGLEDAVERRPGPPRAGSRAARAAKTCPQPVLLTKNPRSVVHGTGHGRTYSFAAAAVPRTESAGHFGLISGRARGESPGPLAQTRRSGQKPCEANSGARNLVRAQPPRSWGCPPGPPAFDLLQVRR